MVQDRVKLYTSFSFFPDYFAHVSSLKFHIKFDCSCTITHWCPPDGDIGVSRFMSLSIDLRWKLLFWRKFSSGIPRSMMPASPPYTYYACPCTDVAEDTTFERTVLVDSTLNSEEEEQDNESTFDPSKPRANHALSPLENLLFCNECHEIRCPRCYYEEVLYYYCPSCLMEIASTTVRTETNR